MGELRQGLVEPVVVLGSSGTRDIPEEDLQTAANFLYAQLREELGKDFELVDVPGPDTLRVAAALTDAAPANQTMVVVSNLVPLAMATSGADPILTEVSAARQLGGYRCRAALATRLGALHACPR